MEIELEDEGRRVRNKVLSQFTFQDPNPFSDIAWYITESSRTKSENRTHNLLEKPKTAAPWPHYLIPTTKYAVIQSITHGNPHSTIAKKAYIYITRRLLFNICHVQMFRSHRNVNIYECSFVPAPFLFNFLPLNYLPLGFKVFSLYKLDQVGCPGESSGRLI